MFMQKMFIVVPPGKKESKDETPETNEQVNE